LYLVGGLAACVSFHYLHNCWSEHSRFSYLRRLRAYETALRLRGQSSGATNRLAAS
jgi:hypothetical protein